MAKSKYYEVTIDDSSYPNISIAHDGENEIVFKGGLIGQKVGVKSVSKKKKKIKAKLLEQLEPSYLEKCPGCSKADICGGCTYQKLTYEDELAYKLDQINKLYETDHSHIAFKINRAPSPTAYRNKMEYTFGDEYKGGPLVLGMHRRNRFYEIVDTIDCNIVHPDINKIRAYTQEFFRESGLDYYHKTTLKGSLRFFVVRYSITRGEIMLNLVTKTDEKITSDLLDSYIKGAKDLDLEGHISSFYHTISNSLADAIIPEEVTLIDGAEYITEEINGLEFRISPFSFFQPNPLGAQNLYNRALEYAGTATDNDLIYDLYSGTGTISQIFASRAKKVIGVEIVKEAVEKAKENAQLNGIKNVEFIANDVLAEIDSLTEKPDIVVLDPPREGIHPTALTKIAAMGAKKIIYISCNPKTQVRDLEAFLQAGYKVEKGEVFDQFARTVHVETVALLSKLDVEKHISVEIAMDELDLTSAESKATYDQIKEYILEKFGFKVSTLYIAQVKRKCGLPVGEHYNKSQKEDQIVPQCTAEKEEAIMDALRHFKMIQE